MLLLGSAVGKDCLTRLDCALGLGLKPSDLGLELVDEQGEFAVVHVHAGFGQLLVRGHLRQVLLGLGKSSLGILLRLLCVLLRDLRLLQRVLQIHHFHLHLLRVLPDPFCFDLGGLVVGRGESAAICRGRSRVGLHVLGALAAEVPAGGDPLLVRLLLVLLVELLQVVVPQLVQLQLVLVLVDLLLQLGLEGAILVLQLEDLLALLEHERL